MKRPFCICIGAYALVAYLTLTFGKDFFSIAMPILSTASALILLLFIIFKKRFLGALTLVCLFSLLSLFKTNYIDLEKRMLAETLHEKTVTVDGEVKTYNKGDKFLSFIVEDEKLGVRVKTYCYDRDLDVDVGKRVTFRGELIFDSESYNKGEETFLTSFVGKVEAYESESVLDKLVVKLRSHVRSSVSDSENQGFLKALIIGDKSDVSTEITDDFKKLGTSHILAISGLHLSILVMSIYLFLTELGASRRFSSLIGIVAAFLYMAVTGFSVSVVRAGQMMIIYFVTRMLRRVNDSITALFTAGFLIVLNSSWTLYSLSFRLSFLSTLGMLVFLPCVSRLLDRRKFEYIQVKGYPKPFKKLRFKFVEYVVISLYSTLSASLFTLPVIILYFNEISLISSVANLLILFFIKYIMITAFLSSTFSFIPAISTLLLLVSDFVSDVTLTISHALASVAPDFFGVDMGFVGIGALLCVALILPSLFLSRKILTLPVTAVAVAIALSIFNFTVGKITYDDVRVSVAWQRGCNALFVSSKDESYFFDMTATSSKNVSPLMTLIEKRRIDEADEAVIILTMGFYPERIDLILDAVKPRKLTLVIAGEFDLDYYSLYEKCREHNVEPNTLFLQSYDFCDYLTFTYYPETCTAIQVKNADNTMTFYKPITLQNVALHLLDADVTFFGSQKFPIENVYKTGDLPQSYWRITQKRIIRE